jgi:hypothetical protein
MAMHGHDPALAAAENYRAFAQEARHRSPVYEALASSVAADAAVLGFLDTLPPEKRQPNLLFAAARYLLGDPLSMSRLRTLISQDRGALEATMLTGGLRPTSRPGARPCCRRWPSCLHRWR